MKASTESLRELLAGVARAEEKLQTLEAEIHEIGQPASANLQKRLDALRIEEAALKRNIGETFGGGSTDESRIARIEALLAHIENEESQIQQDADFLEQAAPTSPELVTRLGDRVVKFALGAIHRVIGDVHPMGSSVFVNHTHEALARRYGISAGDGDAGRHQP